MHVKVLRYLPFFGPRFFFSLFFSLGLSCFFVVSHFKEIEKQIPQIVYKMLYRIKLMSMQCYHMLYFPVFMPTRENYGKMTNLF